MTCVVSQLRLEDSTSVYAFSRFQQSSPRLLSADIDFLNHLSEVARLLPSALALSGLCAKQPEQGTRGPQKALGPPCSLPPVLVGLASCPLGQFSPCFVPARPPPWRVPATPWLPRAVISMVDFKDPYRRLAFLLYDYAC